MLITSGVGIPKGGADGEVLTKISPSDFDAAWIPLPDALEGASLAMTEVTATVPLTLKGSVVTPIVGLTGVDTGTGKTGITVTPTGIELPENGLFQVILDYTVTAPVISGQYSAGKAQIQVRLDDVVILGSTTDLGRKFTGTQSRQIFFDTLLSGQPGAIVTLTADTGDVLTAPTHQVTIDVCRLLFVRIVKPIA